MPTYEYECDACGHRLELVQAMSDAHIRKCPKCAKLKLRRLIGAGAAVIFKGSGFYTTDYRSSSYAEAKKSDVAPPPKTESPEKPADTGGAESKTPPAPATPPAPPPQKKPKKK